MAYSSKGGRPFEYASKAAHGHIINDPLVREFLENSELPKRAEEVSLSDHELLPYEPLLSNPIQHVIAIDGGYDEVVVQSEFPVLDRVLLPVRRAHL